MAATTRADTLAEHALGLPQAWQDFPWEGDRVAKVGKKIFAFLATDDAGRLGVKLPHSGGFALSLACVTPMPYGLGRHGWVTVLLQGEDEPDDDVLRDWITESYRAIAAKTVVRLLDARYGNDFSR
ncbi:MAG TPA: MmcQ/YjbR family DNA-binding protein [Candidatus Deferrimicrobium sp.]|nr:MmcQ/YjbR family DNA-binding protein [Candidatus Deferrimicrobium sp.]